MSVGDSDLRIRPGRIRSTRAPKPKRFINQVLRAAKKAGHTSGQAATGRRSAGYGRSTFCAAGSPLVAAGCSVRRAASW